MLLTEQSAIRGGKATYRGDLRPRELVVVKVRLNDEAKKKNGIHCSKCEDEE